MFIMSKIPQDPLFVFYPYSTLQPNSSSPPFSGSDPIKIYTMVLHGIEKVDFPKRISKRPDDLIRRLCKYVVVASQTAALLANRSAVRDSLHTHIQTHTFWGDGKFLILGYAY